jgi:4-amino-4-deoxy-L-arabinose transferase-like glycosyltransferase
MLSAGIDPEFTPGDSMDMDPGRTNWKGSRWLPYCRVILIFSCSRLVIALALVFSRKYLPTGSDVWFAGPFWYQQLLQWDSEWYFKIATEGYRYNGDPTLQQNIVFYPLYPMLARGLATITGLSSADALLLVSNLAGLFAIVLLFRLVREEFGDQLALATTALLSFFPASVLLSAGYTEPVIMLPIVSFFLVLKRKYYLSAALLAGLAVSVRSTGIVLLPVLLWQMWLNRDHRKVIVVLLCVLLATSGIWLFALYLWSAFGTPFAFVDGQSAFHQETTLATRLVAALELEPFTRMILDDWNPWGQASWFTLLFIVLIVAGWSRLPSSWTLFAIGVLLLPYLTLSGGPAGFVSMSRFNLVSFPLFVVLADLALRAKWLLTAVTGLFGASLFMNAALFARRIWIG